MIKKLKNKFIAISMLSTTLVLAVIIITINIINYANVIHTIDMRMMMLSENGGMLPKEKPGPEPYGDFQKDDHFKGLNAEAPFDTRFFTVVLNNELDILSINTGNINAISEERAIEYVKAVADKNKNEGFYKNYRYKAIEKNGNKQYIFLDCERELNTHNKFLRTSIGISVLGLILVFALVVILSGRMIKPVAESYEKQKRFITDASHEIKTPLTIIEANTEVVEIEAGESEWTRSIRKQIERLTSLTEKLVFLSRMNEENQSYLQMIEFDMSEAIVDTIDPYMVLATTKKKNLQSDIQKNIRYVGDEAAIRQVVSLVLDNAIKYSNDKGDIKIKLSNSGKRIILTVYNTVDEIEIGKHDEMFDRFYRRDNSRNSQTGGFGIGLSTVYAIVQAHKGKVSAKSDDGKSLNIQIIL